VTARAGNPIDFAGSFIARPWNSQSGQSTPPKWFPASSVQLTSQSARAITTDVEAHKIVAAQAMSRRTLTLLAPVGRVCA